MKYDKDGGKNGAFLPLHVDETDASTMKRRGTQI